MKNQTQPDKASTITRDGTDFIIDGSVVADRFGLTVDQFRAALRAADIVTICETGEGDDAGCTRLTFRRGALLWRFVLKADGSIVEDPQLLGISDSRRPKDIGA
jgi:hypothetical protein